MGERMGELRVPTYALSPDGKRASKWNLGYCLWVIVCHFDSDGEPSSSWHGNMSSPILKSTSSGVQVYGVSHAAIV